MKLETVIGQLGGFIRVGNMYSSRLNTIPNQYILNFEKGTVFQSYDSVICVKTNGKIYLTSKWDYSKTTGKYRNQFLGENMQITQDKIKKNEYIILE